MASAISAAPHAITATARPICRRLRPASTLPTFFGIYMSFILASTLPGAADESFPMDGWMSGMGKEKGRQGVARAGLSDNRINTPYVCTRYVSSAIDT